MLKTVVALLVLISNVIALISCCYGFYLLYSGIYDKACAFMVLGFCLGGGDKYLSK